MDYEITKEELTIETFLKDGILFVHKDEILIKDNILKIDFSTPSLRVLKTTGVYVGIVVRTANKRFKIGSYILGNSEVFERKYSDFLIVKEK